MTNGETPVRSTLEALVFPKRLPYWVYWPLIAVLLYAVGEALIRYVAEVDYLWDRILASWAVAVIPSTHIWLGHRFSRIMRSALEPVIHDNDRVSRLIANAYVDAFTFRTNLSKIVVLSIATGALGTVLVIGLPSKSILLNSIALLAFTLFAALCGYALYISVALVITLGRIVREPIRAPFFMIPHQTVSTLQNLYVLLGLMVSLLYTGLIIGVWKGPYGLHPALLVWLTGLAFYPLGIFVVSVTHIHHLMQTLKQAHTDAVNRKVDAVSSAVLEGNALDRADALSNLMEIQMKVQGMREWPFAIQNALALLLALATAGAQLVISFVELFRD